MTNTDAKIMREAFEALAQKALDDGDEDVWRAALNMSVLPDDETLAALRKAVMS